MNTGVLDKSCVVGTSYTEETNDGRFSRGRRVSVSVLGIWINYMILEN